MLLFGSALLGHEAPFSYKADGLRRLRLMLMQPLHALFFLASIHDQRIQTVKPLRLDTSMTSVIGGAFYPTGHSMVMFPTEGDARNAGSQLTENGHFSGDDVYLVTPADILGEIAATVGEADSPLPSAGTDGATVRAYMKLAEKGQHGLLVRTEEDEQIERLMAVVSESNYTMAQRYRTLVIEDL